MINRKAVFADETKLFKTPYEPQSGDTVTLKIRTLANDVLKVYAVINGIKRIMKKLPPKRGEVISIIIRCRSSVRINRADTILYYTTMTTRLLLTAWAASKTCKRNIIFRSCPGSKFQTGRKARYFIRFSATGSVTEILPITSKITSTTIRADTPRK